MLKVSPTPKRKPGRPPATPAQKREREIAKQKAKQEKKEARKKLAPEPMPLRKANLPGHRIFPGLKNAAGVLGITVDLLKWAKNEGCPAFGPHTVREAQLLPWLEQHRTRYEGTTKDGELAADGIDLGLSEEDYKPGIGNAMARMAKQEAALSRKISEMIAQPGRFSMDAIAKAQSMLTRLQLGLLKFETTLDESKRERGEQLAKSDVLIQIRNLVAWWKVGEQTARNNFIPELEGKDKIAMAEIIDKEQKASILYAITSGVRVNKIQQWVADAVKELLL